jgi:Na+(H+)/acetate symporter ActP
VTALLNKVLAGVPNWLYVAGMFLSNIILAIITIEILRKVGRKKQQAFENPVISSKNQEQGI